MKDQFEQIREQIHEIRNFLGPLDLKLEGLDYQVKKSRAVFELKAAELESTVALHSSEIASHAEQIRQIQIFLKMPQTTENRASAPVREARQATETPPVKPPE